MQTSKAIPLKKISPPEMLKFDDASFDDCWIFIFKRFPLEKRIVLEGVSRKWKTLMPYSDITSINLAEDFDWPNDKLIQKQYFKRNFVLPQTLDCVNNDVLHQTLETVLNRCGPYLKEIKFQFKEGQPAPRRQKLFINAFKSAGTESAKRFQLTNVLMDMIVQKAPDLVRLNLSQCLLTLSCFPTLRNLGKLEQLDLGQVLIFDEQLTSTVRNYGDVQSLVASTVENLPTLKKLSLQGWMEVSPRLYSRSLTELLMVAQQMTPEDVLDLVKNCPNLEVLSLWLKPFVFLRMGTLGGLHKLRKLELRCGHLLSEDFDSICNGCPNLEELIFFRVTDLTSCPGLWRLKHLKLLFIDSIGLRPVNDEALISVAQYGLLEDVGIPFADLTDDGLSRLAQYCPNLTNLSVRAIRTISDQGIKVVLESCKKLSTLELTYTPFGDSLMALIGAKGSSLMAVQATETLVTEDGLRMLFEERQKRMNLGEVLTPLTIFASVGCLISKEDLDTVKLIITVSDGHP